MCDMFWFSLDMVYFGDGSGLAVMSSVCILVMCITRCFIYVLYGPYMILPYIYMFGCCRIPCGDNRCVNYTVS